MIEFDGIETELTDPSSRTRGDCIRTHSGIVIRYPWPYYGLEQDVQFDGLLISNTCFEIRRAWIPSKRPSSDPKRTIRSCRSSTETLGKR